MANPYTIEMFAEDCEYNLEELREGEITPEEFVVNMSENLKDLEAVEFVNRALANLEGK